MLDTRGRSSAVSSSIGRRLWRALGMTACLLTLLVSTARAQSGDTAASAAVPAAPAGSQYTIFLLTMGDGAQIWELFGHNGIWVHDAVQHTDVVYNWGVFDFRAPHFLLHFLQGRMMYKVDTLSMAATMYEYRYWNRSVTAQRLALTNAQKLQLVQFLEWNMRPENQFYRYDYFRDNCSTRARDALDRVLGGRIRALTEHVASGTTYREQTLRLMQNDQPIVLGVDIGLGRPSDRPITKYQEMFLPRKLHDFVATLQVPDSAGHMHPLVQAEQVMFQAARPPEPRTVPTFIIPFALTGIIVAVLIVWFGHAARTTPSTGVIAALSTLLTIWALVAGILGLLLTVLWTLTDHVFAHQNENILLFNPVWLALAVMLPVWVARGSWDRATRVVVLIAAALVGVAVLLHPVGLSRQVNLAVICLALPPAAALVWFVATERPRRRLQREESATP